MIHSHGLPAPLEIEPDMIYNLKCHLVISTQTLATEPTQVIHTQYLGFTWMMYLFIVSHHYCYWDDWHILESGRHFTVSLPWWCCEMGSQWLLTTGTSNIDTTHTHTHTNTQTHTHTYTHIHTHTTILNIIVIVDNKMREESRQTNIILQYKLLAAILSAVCSVIQQS